MPEGVPYYPGIAPETPANTGTDVARIVASADLAGSFTRGLAAAAQATAARQRLQLESEQMITDAALKSRQLDILRENNVMDFQVGLKNASMVSDWNSDPTNPLGRSVRKAIATKKLETLADFGKRAHEYGLFEPNPKNPVQFYANKQKLHDEFAFAVDMPEIKTALARFDTISEQHTIPIREGAKLDEKTKTFVAIGQSKPKPVGQIVEALNDPEQQDKMFQLLERNNLVTSETSKGKPKWLSDWMEGKDPISRGIGHVVGKMVSDSYPTTTKTLSPSFGRYMEMGKNVNFGRGSPRTPAAGVTGEVANTETAAPSITQESVDEAGASVATEAGQSVSTPPLFSPTQTEKLVTAYKRGKNKRGFNAAAARQFLIEQKGIDPSLLDSE